MAEEELERDAISDLEVEVGEFLPSADGELSPSGDEEALINESVRSTLSTLHDFPSLYLR